MNFLSNIFSTFQPVLLHSVHWDHHFNKKYLQSINSTVINSKKKNLSEDQYS